MTMLQRTVPSPILSLSILVLWVGLAGGVTWGSVLMGTTLAIVVPLLTASFWPDRPQVQAYGKAISLSLLFLWDIVVANIDVAKRILGPMDRLKPAFLDVPLEIDDPFVATIFASMISLTPGTVSVDIDRERKLVIVHILHVDDQETAIRDMKNRYEVPLKEIFGC